MAYHQPSSNNEQVGFNLLAQRTQQLSNLNFRATNSFLRGNADDYFYSLISLRQNLTPNLSPNERRVLNKVENDIHKIKQMIELYKKKAEDDSPGYSIVSNFSKFRKDSPVGSFMSRYVARIKKFEQLLLIVMKKKGFYPGKADGSSMG